MSSLHCPALMCIIIVADSIIMINLSGIGMEHPQRYSSPTAAFTKSCKCFNGYGLKHYDKKVSTVLFLLSVAGDILNRFSRDMGFVDEMLPYYLQELFEVKYC